MKHIVAYTFTLFSFYIGANFCPAAQAVELERLAKPEFTLVGTIVSNNSQAFALIKNPQQKIQFLKPGEKIHGFILKTIHRNSIQLTRDNIRYTLRLQHKVGKTLDKPNARALISETYIPIKQALLRHIRDNSQKWLSAISIHLQVTEGLMSGYSIESISKMPFNSAIGLKEGDIIKAINGIPVGQSELFAKTVNNLLSVSEISLQVERDHISHIINFSIRE